jgi:N utilization substance protein A
VCNAIQPAEVSRVIIDEANGAMELVVSDDKLSLAIGRRGQNVRLAAQLTGWRLDVLSEAKFLEREQQTIDIFSKIQHVDEHMARTMYKLGFSCLEDVSEADPSELSAIPGIGGMEKVTEIQASAEEVMEQERLAKLRAMIRRNVPITEREKMLCLRGVGDRSIETLATAGYRTIADLANETDVDRLALRAGLGIRRARVLMQSVEQFLGSEEKIMAQLRAEAEAEAAELAEREALDEGFQPEEQERA